MKLRLLVVAMVAALGAGCATTDKSGLAGYKIKPDSTVRHGAPDAQSYYQLARFYHGQKRLDKAEMAYIKAIALDGGRVDSYNALGSLYAERGDLTRAIQQFELAVGINPKSAYVHNNLGYAYFLQGRYEDAYQAVRRGLNIDPTMQRGWINVDLIAKAQTDKFNTTNATVAEAVRVRRLAALPATLVAPAESEAVVYPVVERAQEPEKVLANAEKGAAAVAVADVTPPVNAEPAAESPPLTIVLEDAASARVVAQRPEAAAELVSTVSTSEVSPEKSEESLAGGKFVLVSTSREVVNLTAPAVTATLEAAVAAATPASPASPAAIVSPSEAPVAMPAVSPVIDRGGAIDLSNVDFEVTNANGVTGFAKKFSAHLRNDNIVVKRITNHTSFQFQDTVVEYQPGFEEAAQALIARTRLQAKPVPAKAPRDRSDVRILLGRDIVDTVNTNFAGKAGSAS